MFDRVNNQLRLGPSHVTVEEKKAPTDESVRLLSEMEAAARKRIEQSVRVQDTRIDVVTHTWHDFENHQQVFAVKWSVNGAECVTRVAVNSTKTFEEALDTVHTAVARDIARLLLGDVFESLKRSLRPW